MQGLLGRNGQAMQGLLGPGPAPAGSGGAHANVDFVSVAQRAGINLPADPNSAAWRAVMNSIVNLVNRGMSPEQAAQTVAKSGNAG